MRYLSFFLHGLFALMADKMCTFDAQTAEDFVLVAELKWTVFVINWHMECIACLKFVSFPSMNVISPCYLPHSFAVAVTHRLVFGGEMLGSNLRRDTIVSCRVDFLSLFRYIP